MKSGSCDESDVPGVVNVQRPFVAEFNEISVCGPDANFGRCGPEESTGLFVECLCPLKSVCLKYSTGYPYGNEFRFGLGFE